MVDPQLVGEGFVLFLVVLGFLPVLRAYTVERTFPWLVVGYTALLVGRVAAVAGSLVDVGWLPLVEHGVGVALVAVCFAIHFWTESQYRSDPTGGLLPDGD